MGLMRSGKHYSLVSPLKDVLLLKYHIFIPKGTKGMKNLVPSKSIPWLQRSVVGQPPPPLLCLLERSGTSGLWQQRSFCRAALPFTGMAQLATHLNKHSTADTPHISVALIDLSLSWMNDQFFQAVSYTALAQHLWSFIKLINHTALLHCVIHWLGLFMFIGSWQINHTAPQGCVILLFLWIYIWPTLLVTPICGFVWSVCDWCIHTGYWQIDCTELSDILLSSVNKHGCLIIHNS